jgi:hypothetical protein
VIPLAAVLLVLALLAFAGWNAFAPSNRPNRPTRRP